MTALADRIRGVLNAPGPASPQMVPSRSSEGGQGGDLGVLGGAWHRLGDVPCFVVETRYAPDAAHGNVDVGALARCLEEIGAAARLLTRAPAPAPFVFFDLETTGLNGGAGTRAFLIGCGRFEPDRAFIVRQYLLARSDDEPGMLSAMAGEVGHAGALVSFNGKSFDAPLLESRHQYHRRDWVGARLPHLDMLHVARRFWRGSGLDCSLVSLEQQLLGVRRRDDVAGFEIPARYFHFLRTGDAHPLQQVFEHNRLDLLSLAGLMARAVSLIQARPDHVLDAREALGVGRMSALSGLDDRARQFYERALDLSDSGPGREGQRIEALRALARSLRRSRRFHEAAEHWRRLLDVSACRPSVRSEANEALAVHYEHRMRDFEGARTFALRSLRDEGGAARRGAVEYRLARIQRKLERFERAGVNLPFAEM